MSVTKILKTGPGMIHASCLITAGIITATVVVLGDSMRRYFLCSLGRADLGARRFGF